MSSTDFGDHSAVSYPYRSQSKRLSVPITLTRLWNNRKLVTLNFFPHHKYYASEEYSIQ